MNPSIHATSIVALATLATAFACSSQDSPTSAATEKGEESEAPIEGKFDSFRAPVEHGPLCVPDTQRHDFGEETGRYHAWDLQIDVASTTTVEIRPVAQNLDPVLYLYRKTGQGWGAYIARDDDGGLGMGSLIRRSLEPGEYRFLAKAYKTSMTGPFDFVAEGDPIGCADACDPDGQGTPAPAPQRFNSACVQTLALVQGSKASAAGHWNGVTYAGRCNLPAAAKTALELVNDWSQDQLRAEGREVHVTLETLDNDGTTFSRVEVDDDIGMVTTLLFQGDNLIWRNDYDGMGDTNSFYCSGGTIQEEPSCVRDLLAVVEPANHPPAQIEVDGDLADVASQLSEGAAYAATAYAERQSLGQGALLHVSAMEWGSAARVAVRAEGKTQELFLVNADVPLIIGVATDDSIEFLCRSPW